MIEDFRLKVFVTVAKERSFTRAAIRLDISQPAVSQNISELEKSYGVRFFERLRGEVVLTPAGEIFLNYAQEIINRYSELSLLFQTYPETAIRVSASDEVFSHVKEILLKDFLASHSEITLLQASLYEIADLQIVLTSVHEKRGILALSYYPSPEFASTLLWKALSYALKPTFQH